MKAGAQSLAGGKSTGTCERTIDLELPDTAHVEGAPTLCPR